MIEIMKEFKMRCAHKLANLPKDHKCTNIHGELYTTKFYFRTEDDSLPPDGMLIDFGEIKKAFNESIFETFDHSLLVWEHDPQIEEIKKLGGKINFLKFSPTAENLAQHFYLCFATRSDMLGKYIYKVTVVESEGCEASYIGV